MLGECSMINSNSASSLEMQAKNITLSNVLCYFFFHIPEISAVWLFLSSPAAQIAKHSHSIGAKDLFLSFKFSYH